MLIILRGNSGCGKSTTAKLLRDTALSNGSTRKIAVIEQDYLRRFILKERENEGTDNIDLIYQTAAFALEKGYAVILEGILYSERYGPILKRLAQKAGKTYCYYFDISFEETLRRHDTKPNAHEFGAAEMRAWWHENDLLGLPGESIIPESLAQAATVEKILGDTGL